MIANRFINTPLFKKVLGISYLSFGNHFVALLSLRHFSSQSGLRVTLQCYSSPQHNFPFRRSFSLLRGFRKAWQNRRLHSPPSLLTRQLGQDSVNLRGGISPLFNFNPGRDQDANRRKTAPSFTRVKTRRAKRGTVYIFLKSLQVVSSWN